MLLKAVGQLYGEEVVSSAAPSLQTHHEGGMSAARASKVGDGTWVCLSRTEYVQTPFKYVRRD